MNLVQRNHVTIKALRLQFLVWSHTSRPWAAPMQASFFILSTLAERMTTTHTQKKLETPQMANAQKGIVSPLLILDLPAEASKKDHNFLMKACAIDTMTDLSRSQWSGLSELTTTTELDGFGVEKMLILLTPLTSTPAKCNSLKAQTHILWDDLHTACTHKIPGFKTVPVPLIAIRNSIT